MVEGSSETATRKVASPNCSWPEEKPAKANSRELFPAPHNFCVGISSGSGSKRKRSPLIDKGIELLSPRQVENCNPPIYLRSIQAPDSYAFIPIRRDLPDLAVGIHPVWMSRFPRRERNDWRPASCRGGPLKSAHPSDEPNQWTEEEVNFIQKELLPLLSDKQQQPKRRRRQPNGESKSHDQSKISIVVQSEDVILGRGGHTIHHKGNKVYRSLIHKSVDAYMRSNSKGKKTKIAEEIVKEVEDRGGRFLSKIESTVHCGPTSAIVEEWEVLSLEKARKRVSQRFHEELKLEQAKDPERT